MVKREYHHHVHMDSSVDVHLFSNLLHAEDGRKRDSGHTRSLGAFLA